MSTARPSMNQVGCARLGAKNLPRRKLSARAGPRIVSRWTTWVSSWVMSRLRKSSKSLSSSSDAGGAP
jgi:hypothetical protein